VSKYHTRLLKSIFFAIGILGSVDKILNAVQLPPWGACSSLISFVTSIATMALSDEYALSGAYTFDRPSVSLGHHERLLQ
jgi:hypothetical protein